MLTKLRRWFLGRPTATIALYPTLNTNFGIRPGQCVVIGTERLVVVANRGAELDVRGVIWWDWFHWKAQEIAATVRGVYGHLKECEANGCAKEGDAEA